MSADVLRRAAAEVREDFPDLHGSFMRAVADWLDACALVLDSAPTVHKAHAVRVARAYLGEPE